MRRLLVVFLIALSGCGGQSDSPSNNPSDDNHGFGFQFDAVGSGGLHLRRAGSTTADADFLEARARAVGMCANITAPPPPFVIVVPVGSLAPNAGLYKSAPPLILVEETDSTAFDHEALHYLLDYATGNPDQNHRRSEWGCVLTF